MGFLAKLGKIVANIGSVIAMGSPLFVKDGSKADAAIDKAQDSLAKIAEYIALTEIVGQSVTAPLPGAEKLKGVTPAIAQIIMKSALVAGYEVDQELFLRGCTKMADGAADVINSRKGDPATVKA